MSDSTFKSLMGFITANVAVLLLGFFFFPTHTTAVGQCYSTVFANFDPIYVLQRIALLGVCLLIEWRFVGWKDCSFRKLILPSRSAMHDLVIGAINLCGFAIVLFLFFTANVIPVLPANTREMVGIEWTSHTDNLLFQIVFWFVLRDFVLYWFHRLLHEFAFAWEIHKYHHSATVFTMLTASRVHFLERALSHVFVTLPLVMLGMSGEPFLAITILNDALSRFRHSMVNWGFGWFGWLVVSPITHRIHHSYLPEHWDVNYGDSLTIWDRLFGTFYEGETLNTEVGVTDNLIDNEGFIGGLLIPYALSIRRFGDSLRTNEWWQTPRRRQNEVRTEIIRDTHEDSVARRVA